MQKLPLPQLFGVSVLLAVAGAALYVQFHAWRGDEDPYFLYLLAVGIGTAFAFLADHQRHARLVVWMAAASAVGCCMFGNLRIAMLERAAIAYEFDREALNTEEFFVALEAYLSKYDDDASAPPFTYVAQRAHYSQDEWRDAEKSWQKKTPNERDTIRKKWQSDYDDLNRMGDEGVWNVFFASWSWITYLVAAAIAGGIVVAMQNDGRFESSEWS